MNKESQTDRQRPRHTYRQAETEKTVRKGRRQRAAHRKTESKTQKDRDREKREQ